MLCNFENSLFEDSSSIIDIDETSLIRDYCKICFRGERVEYQDRGAALIEIAQTINDSCDYKLLHSRLVYPERYLHPTHTVEAIKSLLEELSPNFKASEEAKRLETLAIEEFTRCRSTKLRQRGLKSRYEYTNIDTNEVMDYSQFEMRYKEFIRKDKKDSKSDTSLGADNQERGIMMIVDGEDLREEEQETVVLNKENEFNNNNNNINANINTNIITDTKQIDGFSIDKKTSIPPVFSLSLSFSTNNNIPTHHHHHNANVNTNTNSEPLQPFQQHTPHLQRVHHAMHSPRLMNIDQTSSMSPLLRTFEI